MESYSDYVLDFIGELKNKAVRDLAWVIAAPPILDSFPNSEIRFLDFDFFKKEFTRLREKLKELDKHPSPLENFLNNGNTRLLGKYFEKLIEFWLASLSEFDLLASNIQIFKEEKTIGEIDFIIRDKHGEIFHLEVAGKYYITISDTPQMGDFFAPNPKDNLSDKTEKLISTQLQLSNTVHGRNKLNELGIKDSLTPLLLVKGYLFYPLENTNKASFAAEKHLSGFAVPTDKLEKLCSLEKHWVILERKQWIARQCRIPENSVLECKGLTDKILRYFEKNDYPLLVAGVEKRGNSFREKVRAFILPQAWVLSISFKK